MQSIGLYDGAVRQPDEQSHRQEDGPASSYPRPSDPTGDPAGEDGWIESELDDDASDDGGEQPADHAGELSVRPAVALARGRCIGLGRHVWQSIEPVRKGAGPFIGHRAQYPGA